MAWTTPKTWVALAVMTAAELNTHVRDNLQHLYDTRPALTRGLHSGVLDGGGNVVIPHGLGVAPTSVLACLTSDNTASVLQVGVPYVGGIDATNFTISYVRSDTGAALGGEDVSFMWIAVA